MFDINAETIRSYATKENLAKALERNILGKVPHIVVRNDEGRFTAVFPKSFLDARDIPLLAVARCGFMVLG